MEDKPISVHCETYTDIGVFRTTGRSEFASSVQRGILQPSEVTDLSTPVVAETVARKALWSGPRSIFLLK